MEAAGIEPAQRSLHIRQAKGYESARGVSSERIG
jgi:hypothetical protein